LISHVTELLSSRIYAAELLSNLGDEHSREGIL